MGTFVGMMGCIYGREDAAELPSMDHNISFPSVGSCVRAAPGLIVVKQTFLFAGIVD